jgi:sortase A
MFQTTIAPAPPPDPASLRRHRLLAYLEAALWCLALVCLGWVGWTCGNAALYQHRNHDWIESAAPAAVVSDPTAAAAASASHLRPGDPVAELRIPRLELTAVVAEGTSNDVLAKAVGHLVSSAPPGADGNVVFAAHRDTFFRPLEEIQPGDEVIVDTPAGSRTYAVEWMRVVDPDDTSVTRDAGYPALTLVTCFPFRWIGNAPRRFVVRARRTHYVPLSERRPRANTADATQTTTSSPAPWTAGAS